MTILERLSFGFRSRPPIILQTEVAECGLACLAMAASYHGHRIDIGSLRQRFSTSLKGMTVRNLMDVAGRLSLATRAVRAEPGELSQLKMPCILHWEFGHFVVLEKVTRRGAIILDPARGRRQVTHEEFDKSFTGIALELWPAPSFMPGREEKRFAFASLFQNTIGLKRALAQIFLLAACLEFFAILSPLGLQLIIDQAIVGADIDLVKVVILGLALLVLLQTGIGFARSWATMVLMTRLAVQWNIGMFSHLMQLPLAWFEKRHVGDIVSRFDSLKTIQDTLTTKLVDAVMDGLIVVGTFSMMLLYSPTMAAISLATTALYLLVRIVFYRPYRAASEAELVYRARDDSHFMESIRGSASVKALGLEERRQTAWLNILADAVNADLVTDKLDIAFTVINSLLFGLGRTLMLWIGAGAVINGHLTIGMLMAYSAYQEQFTSRIIALIGIGFDLRMLSLQGERLADIALAEPEERQVYKPIIQPSATIPTLEATGLCFRYGDGEPDILHNIDLTVAPGESVAITGASGCGKSTLLKVLAGLASPTQGRICVGERDIREIGLANYRRMTGCVLQNDQLFAGTLAENIAAFDREADQEWVEECAWLAAIDEDISRMPMGYDTLVGDMGSILSGGQKQRIFLARALYRKPHLLFLDEATSHLDEENEEKINTAIANLRVSRIIVAHRPATIAMAGRIIRMG